jgi:hypothetical protein
MSEYIEIETEIGDDDVSIVISTNLKLAEEGIEEYDSAEAMEEGSPLAQSLSVVEGIVRLRIEAQDMIVTRDLQVPWHAIVADLLAALKDFFL